MSDKKPVPPALAEFALEQLAEAGEQHATSQAEELITQLEAEILKRDARIVELEADRNRIKTIADNYSALNMDAQVELAALKAQQPSAGVVDERAAFEAWQEGESPGADLAHCGNLIGEGPSREFYRNSYVSERWIGWQANTRLNPCRAQALMALREAITPEVIDWLKCGLSTNGRLINGTHPALEKLKAAMLAGQPAQQKESGDE